MKNSATRTLVFLSLMITAVTVFISALSENVNKAEPLPVAHTPILHQQEGLININTADIDELTKLSGIGEARARKIIDFRTKNGYFITAEDLLRIDGIGTGVLEKIRNDITV